MFFSSYFRAGRAKGAATRLSEQWVYISCPWHVLETVGESGLCDSGRRYIKNFSMQKPLTSMVLVKRMLSSCSVTRIAFPSSSSFFFLPAVHQQLKDLPARKRVGQQQ